MARNVEIKAHVRDRRAIEALVEALKLHAPEVIVQEDTFFNVPIGRLKLRVFSETRGELIFYERSDTPDPKCSSYSIAPTADPSALKAILSAAFGVRAVVRKTRVLYMKGRTRIHLDDVKGLGTFLELEVVLREGESPADGEATARDLMAALEIQPEDLVDRAYADLLEA